MEPLEVVIVCGFLGSGKTTLLMDHLCDVARPDTAVIVNEVGQIDVDGAVVVAGASIPTVMLSNGCICCSIMDDLTTTVERLQFDRLEAGCAPFTRIVVECSGLSRPGPVLRSLGRLPIPALDARVITTFDALHGQRCLDLHVESISQLAAAQTVVLTKLDMVDEAQRSAMVDLVRTMSPLARLVDEPDRAYRARQAFAKCDNSASVLYSGLGEASETGPASLGHHGVRSMVVRFRADIAWDELASWLDDLTGLCGDRLLRLKGFVKVVDEAEPFLLQSVGTVFSAPRKFPEKSVLAYGLVIIARDVPIADIRGIDNECVAEISSPNRVAASVRRLASPLAAASSPRHAAPPRHGQQAPVLEGTAHSLLADERMAQLYPGNHSAS